MNTPKYIKFKGAVYRLAGTPGAEPLEAFLTLKRAPNFGGYSVELEALNIEGEGQGQDELDLPDKLLRATGQSGHEALASLAAAWSRAGFLD